MGIPTLEDLLIVQVFDALGEEHAKSDDGFKWAFNIPNSMVATQTVNLRGVSNMHGRYIMPSPVTPALNGAWKS